MYCGFKYTDFREVRYHWKRFVAFSYTKLCQNLTKKLDSRAENFSYAISKVWLSRHRFSWNSWSICGFSKYLLHRISPESVNKEGKYDHLSTPLSKFGFHWADFNEIDTLQAVCKDLPESPLTV